MGEIQCSCSTQCYFVQRNYLTVISDDSLISSVLSIVQLRRTKKCDDGNVLLDLRKGADDVKWGSTFTVDSDLGSGSAHGNELLVDTQLLKQRNHVGAHQQCRSY